MRFGIGLRAETPEPSTLKPHFPLLGSVGLPKVGSNLGRLVHANSRVLVHEEGVHLLACYYDYERSLDESPTFRTSGQKNAEILPRSASASQLRDFLPEARVLDDAVGFESRSRAGVDLYIQGEDGNGLSHISAKRAAFELIELQKPSPPIHMETPIKGFLNRQVLRN